MKPVLLTFLALTLIVLVLWHFDHDEASTCNNWVVQYRAVYNARVKQVLQVPTAVCKPIK